jgi:hypothetical protein
MGEVYKARDTRLDRTEEHVVGRVEHAVGPGLVEVHRALDEHRGGGHQAGRDVARDQVGQRGIDASFLIDPELP